MACPLSREQVQRFHDDGYDADSDNPPMEEDVTICARSDRCETKFV